MDFLLRTNIFRLYKEKYRNISELARAMGISAGLPLQGETRQAWNQLKVHYWGKEGLSWIYT